MSARFSLLGGPAFFVLWFVGAQILFFAAGGGVNGDTVPSSDKFPEAMLSNRSEVNGGATLLVLAAISLLWFASGLRERTRSQDQSGLFPLLASAVVAVLLIVQAGLSVGSLHFADQAPETSWQLHELSGILGFESFITSLLAGGALIAFVAVTRFTVPNWFWLASLLIAVALAVGGLLEGFGITPPGRFSILFGLWAFVAGFALQNRPTKQAP